MAAALAIGRQGAGRTAPNPSVGAVIVRWESGFPRIVGLARTADGGRPHAEAAALAMAGDEAQGATCYVTLEPCSHHGRSPPCADALVDAGVARVVVGMHDPNPLVAGKGIRRLEETGIVVTTGVRAREAERDLAGHVSVMQRNRPHVILKMALAADGAIGLKGRGQVPISGSKSNRAVHLLRAQADAIAIGVGTARGDDPRLTVRLPGLTAQSPTRVVFDSRARTSQNASILADSSRVPTVVLVGEGAPARRMAGLRAAGALVLVTSMGADHLDLHAALAKLAQRGINTVLVEGGAALAEALWRDDLIDEAVLIETQTILPNGDVVKPFEGRGAAALAPRLAVREVERMGPDRWVRMVRR